MSQPSYGTAYDDVDVLCPFYIASVRKDRTIVCEGPLPRTKNLLRFRRGEEFSAYMRRYCDRSYKSCEICRAAQKKWEE